MSLYGMVFTIDDFIAVKNLEEKTRVSPAGIMLNTGPLSMAQDSIDAKVEGRNHLSGMEVTQYIPVQPAFRIEDGKDGFYAGSVTLHSRNGNLRGDSLLLAALDDRLTAVNGYALLSGDFLVLCSRFPGAKGSVVMALCSHLSEFNGVPVTESGLQNAMQRVLMEGAFALSHDYGPSLHQGNIELAVRAGNMAARQGYVLYQTLRKKQYSDARRN